MIDDDYYANRHRVLMGRDADFAVAPATTKPKASVTHYLILGHATNCQA